MPELPEVETIVRQLQDVVQGKIIGGVEIFDEKCIGRRRKPLFGKPLLPRSAVSEKIIKIERRAKAILIALSGRKYFFFRLGMTGHFSYAQKKELRKTKYARATLHFRDGSALTFHDIRKFGSLQLFSQEELSQELQKIGLEPLTEKFTPPLLLQLLQKKKNANIKTTLMDQSVIAGIGNIYAQETLYHAEIDPRRKAGSLTEKEAKRLHISLQSTLQRAIAAGGSTVDNYSSLEGAGSFQQQLAVYQREKCPQKHPLQHIVLGGRGTRFCEKCQK